MIRQHLAGVRHAHNPTSIDMWIYREPSEPTNLTVASELTPFQSDFAKPVKGTRGITVRDVKLLTFHGQDTASGGHTRDRGIRSISPGHWKPRSSESTVTAATSPGVRHLRCMIHAASHQPKPVQSCTVGDTTSKLRGEMSTLCLTKGSKIAGAVALN